MTAPAIRVRRAGVSDISELSRHRSAMFLDMGTLAPDQAAELTAATAAYFRDAIPRGEYLAWVAEDAGMPPTVIGGAGVQLRSIIPRPGGVDGALELGPEAIILNVYVEPSWRRRGVGDAIMRAVLAELASRTVRRIVLHASDEGRPLYERLGFTPTNEMRLTSP